MNRQYSQSAGRFNRVDPLTSTGKKEVPQTWNRYGYATSDPINMKDPLGLFACWGCGGPEDPCSINGPSILLDGFEFGSFVCAMLPLLLPSPSPDPELPVAACVVTVTARELNGIGFLGYNHMFITLWDTATNRTDYFGAVGVGGGTGHDGGELVARHGLFDKATATDDFDAKPVKQWTLVLPDSCASMFNFWASETDKINAKHLIYHPVGGPNSNSFVYTLLKRGGLVILIDQINRWVKRNTVPPFGLGPVPGWGLDIS